MQSVYYKMKASIGYRCQLRLFALEINRCEGGLIEAINGLRMQFVAS
jgi:hypothetical protein